MSNVNEIVGLQRVGEAVASLRQYMVETLAQFVSCESQLGQETSAAEFLERQLADLGLESERIYMRSEQIKSLPLFSPACCPDGNRFNVLARHEPKHGGGKSVLFNGHLDVVPTGPHDLWKIPPYSGQVQDGWLYGRGAADMKAGLICALAAYKALRNMGLQPAGAVGFNGVLEEENTGNGTLASVSALQSAIAAAKLTAYDAVIIPEPTQEQMMSSQMGVFWMYVDVLGRPAHAAYMENGVNPVDAALGILQAVKALEAEWNLPENRHPAYREHLHPINFNLGQIHAGDWNSSVPSVCTLGLRLSCYPGMEIDEAKRIVTERIHQSVAHIDPKDIQVKIRYEGFHSPGVEYDLSSAPMKLLAETHQRVSGEAPEHAAMTGTTDGRHFKLMMDVPVTCYGPLSRNVHGFEECVSIDSMVRVATVMAQFMCDWCGVEPLESLENA